MPDSKSESTNDEKLFEQQCSELANKLTETLFAASKAVAICVLPGVMAAVSKTLGVPREFFIQVFDSALEDMRDAT